MKRRRTFTRDFKLEVLRACESGKSKAQVSREYEIHPTLINRWEKEYREDPDHAFQGRGNTYKAEARVAELETLVGRLYAENALFKKVTTSLEKRLSELRKGGLSK